MKIDKFIHDTYEEISFLNIIVIWEKYNLIIFRDNKSLNYIKQYFSEFRYDEKRKNAITPHVILRKEILTKIYKNNKIFIFLTLLNHENFSTIFNNFWGNNNISSTNFSLFNLMTFYIYLIKYINFFQIQKIQ